MNYRHAFHAGNFADVLKHVVLVGLIDALQAKPKPLCYIDTHAGRGRYDLASPATQATGEAADGIARLHGATGLPPLLQRYAELVAAHGAQVYPGSPLLAADLLRDDDSAHLCELQDQEARSLRQLFRNDTRVHVHHRDGYAALKALLPPRERRGLVLVDPPYEAREAEFRTITAALETALQRWPTGVYAIWYPVKLGRHTQPFHRWLRQAAGGRVLVAELLVHADDSPLRLNGAGMAIINPPWQFDRTLRAVLPALGRLLAHAPPARTRVLHLDAT